MEKEIGECLLSTQSTDHGVRKAAENKLLHLENNTKSFGLHLLTTVASAESQPVVRLAAAVYFKNFLKRNWAPKIQGLSPQELQEIQRQQLNLNGDDRTTIKEHLINLMLTSPEAIQKQLMEAVSIISESDYPDQWPGLLPQLIEKLNIDTSNNNIANMKTVNGILMTLYSIFKKYRAANSSQTDVIQQIVYTVNLFAPPFSALFQAYCNRIMGAIGGKEQLSKEAVNELLQSIHTMLKIFYTLNCVDLPEYFEDNMNVWMGAFHQLLQISSLLLPLEDEDEPTVVIQIQAAVCDNINLYSEKYDDEFQSFVGTFLGDVWTLLTNVTSASAFDPLVISGINFLATVSKSVQYKLFEQESVLQGVCEKVIIPNMFLRESDEDNFNENWREYIRRDIEGSDSDTRRRAATELVKGLRKHFEAKITTVFANYIESILKNQADWKNKDAAIYIVTALAITTQSAVGGVGVTNTLVPILDFYQNQIRPDLQNPNQHPILIADALKFTTTFRNQLPKEAFIELLPFLIHLLRVQNFIIPTYAAILVERFLLVREPVTKVIQPTPTSIPVLPLRYTAADISSKLPELIPAMFTALLDHFSKNEQNEYIFKAISRVVAVGKDDPNMKTFYPVIVEKINSILDVVCKNPSNPIFSHYLFETMAILIKATAATGADSALPFFSSFQTVLQNDVSEFSPYVFQCLALMLETRPKHAPHEQAYSILPLLVKPEMWVRSGNIPALVRLLQAFLQQAPPTIFSAITPSSDPSIPPQPFLNLILGVFQKLISSNTTDHDGFFLLEAIVRYLPKEIFQDRMTTVFQLIFHRLTHSKSNKFVRSFVVFLSLFIDIHGGAYVVDLIDSIQPMIFGMVLKSVFLATIGSVMGRIERKMGAVALILLLTETPKILTAYASEWPNILSTLVTGVLEAEAAESGGFEEELAGDANIEITAFSQLTYAKRTDIDPLENITNPKVLLATNLQKLSVANPGKLTAMIPPPLQPILAKYFEEAHLQPPYIV